jgi:hypothetical protein
VENYSNSSDLLKGCKVAGFFVLAVFAGCHLIRAIAPSFIVTPSYGAGIGLIPYQIVNGLDNARRSAGRAFAGAADICPGPFREYCHSGNSLLRTVMGLD